MEAGKDTLSQLQQAIQKSGRTLSNLAKASTSLEKLKSAALFGVTGGLLGACVSLYLATLGIPLWQSGFLVVPFGICIGHVLFRSLRGFRAEAIAELQAEVEKNRFDENLRRMKLIQKIAPPEVVKIAWQGFQSGTFDVRERVMQGPFHARNQEENVRLPPPTAE